MVPQNLYIYSTTAYVSWEHCQKFGGCVTGWFGFCQVDKSVVMINSEVSAMLMKIGLYMSTNAMALYCILGMTHTYALCYICTYGSAHCTCKHSTFLLACSVKLGSVSFCMQVGTLKGMSDK